MLLTTSIDRKMSWTNMVKSSSDGDGRDPTIENECMLKRASVSMMKRALETSDERFVARTGNDLEGEI